MKIERAVLEGRWGQPDFKHWWKVWNGESVFDFYFPNNKPLLVVIGESYFIVDPMNQETINDGDIQIYHVISKKEAV